MKLPATVDFKLNFNNEIWHEFAKIICQKHELFFERRQRAEHGESIIFLVDDRFVVKIYIPGKNGLEREKRALEFTRTSLTIPEIVAFGEVEGYQYLIST